MLLLVHYDDVLLDSFLSVEFHLLILINIYFVICFLLYFN